MMMMMMMMTIDTYIYSCCLEYGNPGFLAGSYVD